MDQQRFDAIAKAVATAVTRRGVLRATLVGFASLGAIVTHRRPAAAGCPYEGQTTCDGFCTDMNWDDHNCGSCGIVCDGSEQCVYGVCEAGQSCPDGLVDCFGPCIDIYSDPTNCGSCGNDCGGGACLGGECCGGEWLLDCGGFCTYVEDDPYNCGNCGNSCSSGQCSNGECIPEGCPDGQVDCGYGDCRDLSGDSANCGACGNYCWGFEQAISGCIGNGVCECIDSNYGNAYCDGCTFIDSDPYNCGGCGTVCGSGDCRNGSCVSSGCGSGRINCGGCVDPDDDPYNCGGCGIVCQSGQCESGRCRATNQGCGEFTECDGLCVDLASDLANCGACGVACPPNSRCRQGQCSETASPSPSPSPTTIPTVSLDDQEVASAGGVWVEGAVKESNPKQATMEIRNRSGIALAFAVRMAAATRSGADADHDETLVPPEGLFKLTRVAFSSGGEVEVEATPSADAIRLTLVAAALGSGWADADVLATKLPGYKMKRLTAAAEAFGRFRTARGMSELAASFAGEAAGWKKAAKLTGASFIIPDEEAIEALAWELDGRLRAPLRVLGTGFTNADHIRFMLKPKSTAIVPATGEENER